jgi:hypothetical protein
VPLRERHARAGLQVSFEAQGSGFVGEFDHYVQSPRSPTRRVRARTGVVRAET